LTIMVSVSSETSLYYKIYVGAAFSVWTLFIANLSVANLP
jgi:hypothetical protein